MRLPDSNMVYSVIFNIVCSRMTYGILLLAAFYGMSRLFHR